MKKLGPALLFWTLSGRSLLCLSAPCWIPSFRILWWTVSLLLSPFLCLGEVCRSTTISKWLWAIFGGQAPTKPVCLIERLQKPLAFLSGRDKYVISNTCEIFHYKFEDRPSGVVLWFFPFLGKMCILYLITPHCPFMHRKWMQFGRMKYGTVCRTKRCTIFNLNLDPPWLCCSALFWIHSHRRRAVCYISSEH